MENRALVIKTYGNPEIGGAIRGAILDNVTREVIPLNDKELEKMKEDYKRMKAREGVRHTKAADEKWEETKQELAIEYGVKPHGKIYNALLLGWAILNLAIMEGFARLWAGIEGKRYTRRR